MNEAVFTTARLVFRPFEACDADALERISADEATRRYVGDGSVLTRAECELWIRKSRENIARHGYGTGAVVLKASGALIGWAGMARPGDGTEEVIYGLHREFWGKGLGSELLQALVGWARETLALHELRATVDAANRASVALLDKHGFKIRDDCYQGEEGVCLYVLEMTAETRDENWCPEQDSNL